MLDLFRTEALQCRWSLCDCNINPMEVGGLSRLYNKNSNATDLTGAYSCLEILSFNVITVVLKISPFKLD